MVVDDEDSSSFSVRLWHRRVRLPLIRFPRRCCCCCLPLPRAGSPSLWRRPLLLPLLLRPLRWCLSLLLLLLLLSATSSSVRLCRSLLLPLVRFPLRCDCCGLFSSPPCSVREQQRSLLLPLIRFPFRAFATEKAPPLPLPPNKALFHRWPLLSWPLPPALRRRPLPPADIGAGGCCAASRPEAPSVAAAAIACRSSPAIRSSFHFPIQSLRLPPLSRSRTRR
mmetsp:Transcript_110718/g.226544  ORF Transcript_110718/g.226544 Transcript_110718/m.226544 type:complete len:223 (-) Transcript_110718:2441-3109(-)